MGCLCSTNNVANDTLDSKGACSEVQQQSSAPGSLFPDLQVPIYFIKLESLLSRDTFPRYPENKDLAVSLDDIDITNSFLVFVSHCWARGALLHHVSYYYILMLYGNNYRMGWG